MKFWRRKYWLHGLMAADIADGWNTCFIAQRRILMQKQLAMTPWQRHWQTLAEALRK
jgi:hypothetical protein